MCRLQLTPEQLAQLENLTLADAIGILLGVTGASIDRGPVPPAPERRSRYTFAVNLAFARMQTAVLHPDAWAASNFASGKYDETIELWATEGVAANVSDAFDHGTSMMQSEPVKDNRPPVERSMERLRIAVNEVESAGHRLRTRLGPVMRPESKAEADGATGMAAPPTSDHTFQIESVVRHIGWVTNNLEDILARLETPQPPPDSPGPSENTTKG